MGTIYDANALLRTQSIPGLGLSPTPGRMTDEAFQYWPTRTTIIDLFSLRSEGRSPLMVPTREAQTVEGITLVTFAQEARGPIVIREVDHASPVWVELFPLNNMRSIE